MLTSKLKPGDPIPYLPNDRLISYISIYTNNEFYKNAFEAFDLIEIFKLLQYLKQMFSKIKSMFANPEANTQINQ